MFPCLRRPCLLLARGNRPTACAASRRPVGHVALDLQQCVARQVQQCVSMQVQQCVARQVTLDENCPADQKKCCLLVLNSVSSPPRWIPPRLSRSFVQSVGSPSEASRKQVCSTLNPDKSKRGGLHRQNIRERRRPPTDAGKSRCCSGLISLSAS
jgi:hypothetical protein